MRKPDFFIVGAPKCGTTALAQYLGQHPDIYMAPKELQHFGKDLIYRGPRRFEETRRYRELFSAAEEQRAGEASVWYLYSQTAAQEIHDFNPDSQIIVMLRNPVDFLYSLYFQLLWSGDEDLEAFELALAAEPDRKAGQRLPDTTAAGPIQALYYLETARFSGQLDRYIKVFGKDRIHVIIYDDFAKDTTASYRNVLQFLGIDCSFTPQFKIVNSNKIIRNITFWRFMKFGQPLLRSIWRAALPETLRGKIVRMVNQLNTY